MLHKIGRTGRKDPLKRVNESERNNQEKYHVNRVYRTQYNSFFEMMIHTYFRDKRVEKPDSKDGKTEWFVLTLDEIYEAIEKM